MDNIFKSNIALATEPQATWLYEVCFNLKYEDKTMLGTTVLVEQTNEAGEKIYFNKNDPDLVTMKIDLPKFEVKTVTQRFLGTEKTFPIYRSNAGETTLEFILRNSNNKLLNMLMYKQLFNERHHDFSSYIKNMYIKLYNRDGKNWEAICFNNPIITAFDAGSLSYEDESVVKYNITVHYDSWSFVGD